MINGLPRVRVVNPGDSWPGTECYIEGKKINKVMGIDFSVVPCEIPTFKFETIGVPDIDISGRVIFDCKPESVTEAVKILRNELLNNGSLYAGFISSIASALKYYYSCGIPSDTDEYIAKKILDCMIGEK